MPILRPFPIVAAIALWLVVAAASAATDATPASQHYSGTEQVFHCTFDPVADGEQVNWPQRWNRERSAKYPPYLEVRIDNAAPPETSSKPADATGRSLRMDLDGGAAAVFSPAIPTSASFSYVFECVVQTEGLVHDRASMSVTFYDGNDKVLERQVSSPIGTTTAWTRLRIGPVTPASDKTDHAIIGLHLEPGDRADLKGTAWFADVWAARLPRMSVEADRRTHLYLDTDRASITCSVSGIDQRDKSVTFTLLDVDGRQIARETVPIAMDRDATDSPVLSGNAIWHPNLPGPGFYRAIATLAARADEPPWQEITLAVIHDQATPSGGEFGWTVPQGAQPLSLSQLADLAAHGGISWLKFPVSCGDDAEARIDALTQFAEQLEATHVQMVGVLADFPKDVRKHFGDAEHTPAAQVFSTAPKVWYPSLDQTIERLARQIHWWQLGSDGDLSFVGLPQLAATIEQVHKQLGCYGQDIRLGFAWSATQEMPRDKPTWDFVNVSAKAQAAEGASITSGKYRRFANLDPLLAGQFNVQERARNLSLQMLAAKLDAADAIFVPDLCNTQHGLMNDDGTVGELLLPWRTTAQSVGGAKSLGSMTLAGGSANQVFARGDHLTMVLWNEKPCEEKIALGDKAHQVDLWGRPTQPMLDLQGQARIQVDRLPIILTELNEPLTRWQLSTTVSPTQWPNEFGKPQNCAVTATNPFPESVAATLRLTSAQRWRIVPREIKFKLAAGESRQIPFEVTLPLDASTGQQLVRLDFELAADRPYQFTVYRSVQIGTDDVVIDVTTHLDDNGDLIVEQMLMNKTDQKVSFKCALFAADRRRMATQVLDQARGSDVQTYHLPNGRALLGQTLWLRAEEIDGRRMLNYRFIAQP